MRPALIAVLGPTASGKTALAEGLAASLGARLISADAFQVYRRFDIGTAKPKDRSQYALIDICEPTEPFGAGDFVKRCLPILEDCHVRGRHVIVAGGTGFYVRALMEEYAEMAAPPDPAIRDSLMQQEEQSGLQSLADQLKRLDPASEVDMQNPVRVRRALERLLSPSEPIRFTLPPFRRFKFGLELSPASLEDRITRRIGEMMEEGWEGEVRSILAAGVPRNAPAWRAIGYETLVDMIEGRLGRAAAMDLIAVLTRQYAKRQRTWLRSEPRMQWVSAPLNEEEGLKTVESLAHQVAND